MKKVTGLTVLILMFIVFIELFVLIHLKNYLSVNCIIPVTFAVAYYTGMTIEILYPGKII